MKVVAMICARHDELFLERGIQRSQEQGETLCPVDHESTDRTREIAWEPKNGSGR